MSFNPSKSGTYRIGVRQHGGQLEARLNAELKHHMDQHLTDELSDRIINDIAEVVADVSEEQGIDSPHWVIVMDFVTGGVHISFRDEDGVGRTIDDLELEIHRRAVYQML